MGKVYCNMCGSPTENATQLLVCPKCATTSDDYVNEHYGYCIECQRIIFKDNLVELGTSPINGKEHTICKECVAKGVK